METVLSLIVIVVIIVLIYNSVQNSKEKDRISMSQTTERLVKEASEFEAEKTLYNQFKDYISNLYLKRSAYSETELKQIFKRDFPLYKSADSSEFGSLFMDLLKTGVIEDDYSKTPSDKRYIKGRAFTDIRLNFREFLRFSGSDMFGRKFENNGFLDNSYSNEAVIRRIIHHEKNSEDVWRLREYNFGICTGENLKKRKRTLDFEPSYKKLYLFQDFEVIYVTNTSSTAIKVEEIEHDKSYSEYKKLFDEGYKTMTQMT
jgi:hypothetical protein